MKRGVNSGSPAQTIAYKVFVRTNRKGGARKIVREQYLRSDIPCSSQACKDCILGAGESATLSKGPNKTLKRGPHYVIVDTNIVLTYIDLLENTSVFYDVIVPQVVLEEVKNRSFPLYSRLRNLVSSSDKRFYVFHNEFFGETHVDRNPGETINDRNDRAIRKLASWYAKHLKPTKIQVVLISDDRLNREAASKEEIVTLNMKEYLSEQTNSVDLLELMPSKDKNSGKTAEDTQYEEYYSRSRLMAGVKNGAMHQGNLQISPYNFLEGQVSSSAFAKPILILGRKNLNRGFNGDQVVVEMLPKSQWKLPSDQVLDDETINKAEDADVNDDPDQPVITDVERRALAKEAARSLSSKEMEAYPTAKVVGILKRSWRFYVGHVSQKNLGVDSNTNSTKAVLVEPLDKCIPRIRIRTRKAFDLVGKRIVVAIDDWPVHSRHPEGHFVRSLGEIESEGAETEALLLEHDIEFRPFPQSVLSCLPPEGDKWVVPEKLPPGRQDLRHLNICSIDPVGCQDIDDALHAHVLPNGNYHVGVHIADVTNFVKPNTALDEEGASRGTSTYLVNKRIDMLPSLLGTNLCSLMGNVERYAFSVLWEMTPEGEIIDTQFTKSVIYSRHAFSYEEAQVRIDDASKTDDLTKGMRILLALSKILKRKRIEAGALNLASPEVKVQVESETSDPGDIEIKQLLDTNSLVEEFMLLANISVAKQIYNAFPQTAMLRRHAPPNGSHFDILNKALRVKKGMALRLESSRELADSLDECVDPNDPFFNTLIRIMATRCMTAAEYFPSGTLSYPEFRHYGLASEIYTHFTSPIRRYADVVAHRQLAASIGYETLDPSHRDKEKMERICKNINTRHRNAQLAGRASIEYHVGQVLKKSESVQEGHIIRVFDNGIAILVPKFGVESLIKLEDIGSALKFDEDLFELKVVDKTGNHRTLSIFDKVQVMVESIVDSSGRRKVKLSLK